MQWRLEMRSTQFMGTKPPARIDFRRPFTIHFGFDWTRCSLWCTSFFETKSLHKRHNETHVRLIPKITVPKKVVDYRPIALCSTHYKIIAKIITKRLQPLLTELISPHQSAFVPQRSISDNVLITHEILHYFQTSKASKRCSMVVKMYMSKAYDRIEWGFLKVVLTRLSVHELWIDWIVECVETVSYSFLINGSPKGWFSSGGESC